MAAVKIYHNTKCATSRKALALLRDAGVEPEVVEYLKTPLLQADLTALVAQLAVPARTLVRTKGKLYKALGLDDQSLSDEALLAAIAANPELMERPIVVSDKGAKICRPFELAQTLL